MSKALQNNDVNENENEVGVIIGAIIEKSTGVAFDDVYRYDDGWVSIGGDCKFASMDELLEFLDEDEEYRGLN
jgi:hypothetical protein